MNEYEDFRSSTGAKVFELVVAASVLTCVAVAAVGAFFLAVGV